MARQSVVESEDYPTFATLGLEERQLVTLGHGPQPLLAIAGAIGAVALAMVLSPIAPVGEARIAELSDRHQFDSLVLIPGLFA